MADLFVAVGLALAILAAAGWALWRWLSDRAEARRARAEFQRIEASWAEDLRAGECRRWSRGRKSRRAHG